MAPTPPREVFQVEIRTRDLHLAMTFYTKTNPVVLYEIASPNLAAATKYYSELVSWSFWGVVFSDKYAFAEGCGLARGVGLVGTTGAHGTVNYVSVANIAQTVARVQEAGGHIVAEPTDFPGEGRYFVFEDPEGNRMGALEKAPSTRAMSSTRGGAPSPGTT
jgi:predicted enzyme related to lactoylglutathione lyase